MEEEERKKIREKKGMRKKGEKRQKKERRNRKKERKKGRESTLVSIRLYLILFYITFSFNKYL